MIRGLIVILWRTPEYTARGIFSSNMVLGSVAAHALKIACRQNRCADKSLRPARAAPFYLAPPVIDLFRSRCRHVRSLTLHIRLHFSMSRG